MSEANPWRLSFMAMFHMANDSHLFANAPGPGRLPLYEAKMIHQFDHRFGTYAGQTEAGERQGKLPELDHAAHGDPFLAPLPRYWVDATEVASRLAGRWPHRWLLGWRDITGTEKIRTVIAGVIPRSAVNDKFLLMMPAQDTALVAALYANLCSFVLDYAARQKVGGTSLKYFTMRQLPVLPPEVYGTQAGWAADSLLGSWLLPRVLELTYTAWDLQPFANDSGWPGPPFRWNEDRRFLLRCELDAAFFHLYLGGISEWGLGIRAGESDSSPNSLPPSSLTPFPTPRDAVAYIMDTFPIVRRKDEAKYDGDYRTKRVILEIYDAMQEAIRTGEPYQTRLDPPPADPSCCHPPLPLGILAYGSLIQDPGPEIEPQIRLRIDTETDFPVEYARLSTQRGGAPTLVPHPAGAPVKAQILVLDDEVSADLATDMLWRRETGTQDRTQPYPAGTLPNSVQCQRTTHPSVTTVLYTDFLPAGKIDHPTAVELSKTAIASVAKVAPGQDGITYLRNAIAAGIKTPLTDDYKAQILLQTRTESLREALAKILANNERNSCGSPAAAEPRTVPGGMSETKE